METIKGMNGFRLRPAGPFSEEKILQQAWMGLKTGKTYWRDVETISWKQWIQEKDTAALDGQGGA